MKPIKAAITVPMKATGDLLVKILSDIAPKIKLPRIEPTSKQESTLAD